METLSVRGFPSPFRREVLVASLLWVLPAACAPAPLTLPQVAPEEVGWASEGLAEAADYAEKLGFDAFMVAQGGRVIFSWGRTDKPYRLHSVRKPLLGALYGLYASEGVLELDRTLGDLGIDDRPPRLTAEEKLATVRDLLEGRSGVYHPAAAETREMSEGRPDRGSYDHGEHFYYNNWDFNALGTILRQVTGKDIFQDFKERIADPIGMQDFDPDRCGYEGSSVSDHPSYSFRMSARDLLRFGILYQQGGSWNGVRILPQSWIDQSTSSAHGITDQRTGTGFGYLWGVMYEGGALAELTGGSGYFFSGLGTQYLVVIPRLELVYVLRTNTDGPFGIPQAAAGLLARIRDARVGG